MELETVFIGGTPAEAQLARARLEAAGFAATVAHELSALNVDPASMAIGGSRVQVPQNQAEEAKRFLATATPPA